MWKLHLKKATPNKLCTDKGGWDVLLTKTAHFNIIKSETLSMIVLSGANSAFITKWLKITNNF